MEDTRRIEDGSQLLAHAIIRGIDGRPTHHCEAAHNGYLLGVLHGLTGSADPTLRVSLLVNSSPLCRILGHDVEL